MGQIDIERMIKKLERRVCCLSGSSGSGAVSSVFGRTGVIVATSGDYSFAQLSSTPTTLSGYGITDSQPLDGDLTAIAALSSNGFAKRTGANTWTIDTSTYLTSLNINQLGAASGVGLIDNTSNGIEWQWNTLGGTSGLKLTSTSTAAASNLQKILEVLVSGANTTTTQTTYAGYFSNTHTGTSSTNYGLYATASGGSNNTAAYFNNIIEINATANHIQFRDANNAANLVYRISCSNIGGSATADFYISDVGASLTPFALIAGTGNLGLYGASGFVAPTSGVQVFTSLAVAYIAKTANYTATIADYFIDCTSNSFTITLPTAVGITGRQYIIKNSGTATTITIATTSSQTIDGSAPTTITTAVPLRVLSDGANWKTF